MKILCVIDSLGSGGAQRQLVNLSIGFKEKGHEVRFLVYHEENFFRQILDDADIVVDSVIESSYLKRLLKIRKYIRKGKFDAVLSFLEATSFICEFSGLPWRKWKLVVGERSANPNILKSMKLRFYRWFHLFADSVVSNSHENLMMVRKVNPLLSKSKLKVIYNIVDITISKESTTYVPLADGKLHLVIAASHQHLKNANGLIQAVSKLPKKCKEMLVIEWYGDKSPDKSYEEAIRLVEEYSLEQLFTFQNATESIIEVMSRADAIGLFSFYEGLPNVVCEGVMLGKPIIASSVSDIPRIVSDKELLFDPNDPNDLLRALTHLVSLDRAEIAEIGARNKKLNEGQFDREEIINKYLCLML